MAARFPPLPMSRNAALDAGSDPLPLLEDPVGFLRFSIIGSVSFTFDKDRRASSTLLVVS